MEVFMSKTLQSILLKA